jgi:hypothetical protein
VSDPGLGGVWGNAVGGGEAAEGQRARRRSNDDAA